METEDIEQEIADAIIDIVPDTLIACISKIEKYIRSSNRGSGGELENYKIPKRAMGVKWYKPGKNTKKQLDALYLDKKQDIYETLAKCLGIIEENAELESMPKHFKFRITQSDYNVAQNTLVSYATNQLMIPWQEGKPIPKTYLSGHFGLNTREEGDLLYITSKDTQRTCYKDTPPEDTTTFLPFLVFVLNKFYAAAKKIA